MGNGSKKRDGSKGIRSRSHPVGPYLEYTSSLPSRMHGGVRAPSRTGYLAHRPRLPGGGIHLHGEEVGDPPVRSERQ